MNRKFIGDFMWIDDSFNGLINEFKANSTDKLFSNMKNRFLTKVPIPIQDSLSAYWDKYPYWGRLSFKDNVFDILHKKAEVFKDHFDDFAWLYERLADCRSKFVLYAILSNFYNFDFINLKKAIEPIYSQYFDLDILPKLNEEIFVDVGAYYGETAIDFVRCFGRDCYKKIYCYEITPNVIEKMKENLKDYQNIEIVNKAVGEGKGKVFLEKNLTSDSANQTKLSGEVEIEQVSLDDDIKDKISMIKMDIEGGEKAALKGCVEHIKKDFPNLMLSVYHNNTDLFEIPRMIENVRDDYKFYLRYYGGNVYATEIILYCIKTF